MSIVKSKYRGTKEYSLVYTELIIAAKYRGTVTYQEIAKIIGLPLQGNHMGGEIGQLLGEISEDEATAGRPMLSAIAVSVDGSLGKGFYTLARQLGKLQDEDDQAFWEKERQLVYDTWKTVLK
jgi:hypothetical protein